MNIESKLLPSQVTSQDTAWREGLLERVRYLICVVWLFVAFAAIFLARSDIFHNYGVMLVVVLAPVFFLLRSPKISYLKRVWITIACLGLAAVLGFFLVGFNSGPALGVTFCLVLSALLLGIRPTASLLVVFGVILATMTALVWSGIWHGPPAAETNPNDPMIWTRTSIISLILLTGITNCVLYVVRNMEHVGRRREQVLEKLHATELRRATSEKARRDAETIAFHAQKLNAMGQLAAGVAHDFNNSLLVVIGWNDMLCESGDAEMRRRATGAIGEAAQQAADLARQLLTFGHKSERFPRYVNGEQVVRSTLTTLQRLLPSSISVRVTSDPDTLIYADESQIRQLIYNLVINARDAFRDGRGVITVECCSKHPLELDAAHNEIDADKFVRIVVADNGVGIPDDVMQHILEPFFTTKQEGVGTGIGLSMVVDIVNQNGGHLEVKSEPGQGTRVEVLLPATELPAAAVDAAVAEPTIHSKASHVLVVEDDPLARDLISYALIQEGHHVTKAIDGDAAIQLLHGQSQKYDVLCSDAIFPGASVNEVIATFENCQPQGKVLICSGYSQEDLASKGIGVIDHEYLAKPFKKNQLTGKVAMLTAA